MPALCRGARARAPAASEDDVCGFERLEIGGLRIKRTAAPGERFGSSSFGIGEDLQQSLAA
jgi:hypothetical protein